MPVRCLILVLLFVAACSPHDDTGTLIEDVRRTHGSNIIDNASIAFDFRGDAYRVLNQEGRFEYSREYAADEGWRRDVMTNDSTFRLVEGAPVPVDDAERRRIESTVNSVVYFVLLPYNLADPAVQARTLGETVIRDEPYHVVEITFVEEGGGRDWEDRYVYWFHRDHKTMDFLAYTFDDADGGGSRFREATNPRSIGGVRFQDYRNFSVDTLRYVIEDYPRFLESNELTLVSTVDIDDIRVE